MTTEIQTTLARQFAAVGPRNLNGRARFPAAVALEDGVSVRWQYRSARKRRGALTADMTIVTVTYDEGADLYDVKIADFDGLTCESGPVRTIEGLDCEQLANVTA